MKARVIDPGRAGRRRIVGIGALALAVGFESTAMPAIPLPVIQGTPSDDYPAVVLLWLQEGDSRDEGAMACTGFLVSPEWLVTAAHCTEIMDETVADGSVSAVWAMIGSGLDDAGARWVRASMWVGHEDFAIVEGSSDVDPPYEGALYVNDIGLVQLSEPVLDVAPLPVVCDDFVQQLGAGDLVRVAGFGWQSDGGGEGTLRWADLEPVFIDDQALWMRDPEGYQNICLGDSGGPALLPGSEGGWLAAAINVQLVWFDENYACRGSGARSIRLDQQRGWVEQWVELMDYDAWLEQYGDAIEPDDTALPKDSAPPDSRQSDCGEEIPRDRGGRGCGCGRLGEYNCLSMILGVLAIAGARRSSRAVRSISLPTAGDSQERARRL